MRRWRERGWELEEEEEAGKGTEKHGGRFAVGGVGQGRPDGGDDKVDDAVGGRGPHAGAGTPQSTFSRLHGL